MPGGSDRADGEEGVSVQVTRQRRRVPRRRLVNHRRRFIAAGAVTVLLAGAGATYASTEIFGTNEVGAQTANGLQVSDDQLLAPLGERLVTQMGKFMGSSISPDGR